MKKLLTVSLFAIMAVSAANADIASTDYVTARTGDMQFTDTGITKDATNLTEAVVALDNNFSSVSGSIEEQIAAVTDPLSDRVDKADGKIQTLENALKADGTTGKAIADNAAAISAMDTAYKAADTALDGRVGALETDNTTNQTNISTLQSDVAALKSGDNSVAKQIETALTNYSTTAQMNSAIATADTATLNSAKAYTDELKNGAVKDNTDAISAIHDETTGILALAKADAAKYIDADELSASQTEQDTILKKYADDAAAAVGTAASGALSTKLADYSTTEQMNSAIAAADTALETKVTNAYEAADTALETSLQSYADTAEADAIAAAKTAGDAAYAVKGTEDVASGNTTAINTINTNLGALAGIKIPAACATGRCALVMENNQAKWETINY